MVGLKWIGKASAVGLVTTGLLGCNVFFGTNSVEFGGQANNGAGFTECASSCTCSDNCARSCDAECTLRCTAGTTCDFSLRDGGKVTCENGADCNVACEGGDCETVCEGSCTMQCAPGAGACGWDTCEGARSTCGTRGLSCDADCP